MFRGAGGRRGQASTEYLMMAAIVLIVALLSWYALGGFPVLITSVGQRESQGYWFRDATVGLQQPIFMSGASGSIGVLNRKDFDIVLLNISDENNNLITLNASMNIIIPLGQVRHVPTHSTGRPCWNRRDGDVFEFAPQIFYYEPSNSSQAYQYSGAKKLAGTCGAYNVTPGVEAPSVSLSSPTNNYYQPQGSINFQFVPTDDQGFSLAELWTNYSGGSWAVAQANTSVVSNASTNTIAFSMQAPGTYRWNVRVCDDAVEQRCSVAPADYVVTVIQSPGFFAGSSPNYKLWSPVFDSGGGNSSSASYKLAFSSAVCEAAADAVTSTSYKLYAGPAYSR